MGADFTFLKGNIETIILSALYENDKYGYELAKEIKKKTSNKYEVKQPTLYAYLRRLEEDDLIVSYWGETSNGGRRRYYKITKHGKENYERFMSEWNFQKSVLDDLVDGDAETTEMTQSDVTPMFGRKSARKSKSKDSFKASLDEQDEIARRLNELLGAQNNTSTEAEEETTTEVENEVVVKEEPAREEQQQVIVEDYTVERVAEEPVIISEPQYDYKTEEDTKARFDVHQENADIFIKRFDERAREVSERDISEQQTDEGENYQHVLLGVIGDQLEGVDAEVESTANRSYYSDNPSGLEEIADNFAKEGIRVRIYNHANAVYKSKMLIPLSRVLCETAWITYALAFIYYGILALTSAWLPFVITLAALLIVPIAFSIHLIVDPTRKDKPTFNFKITIIVAAVISVIIVLCAVGFSALGNLEFSNFQEVSIKILIPTGIALLLPISIMIFNFFYKKY